MQCNPYQTTNGIFFTELEQIISQFLCKYKRSGHGRRKEIIKIRVEINEIETKKTIAKINETKSQLCENINKIDKLYSSRRKGEDSNQ